MKMSVITPLRVFSVASSVIFEPLCAMSERRAFTNEYRRQSHLNTHWFAAMTATRQTIARLIVDHNTAVRRCWTMMTGSAFSDLTMIITLTLTSNNRRKCQYTSKQQDNDVGDDLLAWHVALNLVPEFRQSVQRRNRGARCFLAATAWIEQQGSWRRVIALNFNGIGRATFSR